MEKSRYTDEGKATFRIELGDEGVLLGLADQQDHYRMVVLDCGGTLKSVSSARGHRAVSEGDKGSRWDVIPFEGGKVQLRRLGP